MRILTELRKANNLNDKITLLKDADPLCIKAFEYATNPYKVYGIGKYKDIDMDNLREPFTMMFDLLDDILEKRIPLRDAKVKIEQCSSEGGNLIKLIINKSLDCGVSVATLNKAYPSLIPVFKIQKAKSLKVYDVEFPKLLEQKYDGVRILAKLYDGKVTLYTSSGRIPRFPNLEAQLIDLKERGVVLDGELIWGEGKQKDRPIIIGKLASALKGGIIDESLMQYKVFDSLTRTEFLRSKCCVQLSDRLKRMPDFSDTSMISLSKSISIGSANEAEAEYVRLLKTGFEGIMLKDKKSIYRFKQSNDWIKVKATKTADLVCINVIQGKGQFEGMIGALSLAGDVEGVHVDVNVGSGLTASDRAKPEGYYLGEMIEVKYNSVSRNKDTDQRSLFIPRFNCVRIDL